jgi:adenylate cyclase
MHIIKSLVLFIWMMLATTPLSAQQTHLDSLWAVWNNPSLHDTLRLRAIYDYAWDGYLNTQPDSAIYFAKIQYAYAESKGLKKDMANALSVQGQALQTLGDMPGAIQHFLRQLTLDQDIGNHKRVASTYYNIGAIYLNRADHGRALDYFLLALKGHEKTGNKVYAAQTVNVIGVVYGRTKDWPNALEYYQRALDMSEELGDKGSVAGTTINMGLVYEVSGDSVRALDYLQRGLKLAEEIGLTNFAANALSALGDVYMSKGDFNQALQYLYRSLDMMQETGSEPGIASVSSNIGNLFYKKGEYKTSIEWCKRALKAAEEGEAIDRQKEACSCLYDAYKAMGNSEKTLQFLERIGELDEQLQADETKKKLQQMEFDKVMLQDSIAKAEEARLIEEAHQEEVQKKNQTRNYLIAGGLLSLVLEGGIFNRLRYTRKSKAVLQVEKDRSENLLLNILPAEIAEELKAKGRADARDFDMVSILFTDFKGFTEASAKLSAQDLVAEINACFEVFDGIMAKYGIEKIKTIGDAYMAAGGLPVPKEDSVKNTVLAALEMQDFIEKRKVENNKLNKPAFEMRAGIHTGPVVAGIVGVKKFQYDIWGDTVNTASRMETNSEPGKVNVSQGTYELLKNDNGFVFEFRGKVEAKGKGEVEMYFVSKA